MMGSCLDNLVNDIKLMVYRYIHLAITNVLHAEYRSKFQMYWMEDESWFEDTSFDCGIVHLNYRNLNFNVLDVDDEYTSIYNFSGTEARSYVLSQNYAHAVVWWPLPLFTTHTPVIKYQAQQEHQ